MYNIAWRLNHLSERINFNFDGLFGLSGRKQNLACYHMVNLLRDLPGVYIDMLNNLRPHVGYRLEDDMLEQVNVAVYGELTKQRSGLTEREHRALRYLHNTMLRRPARFDLVQFVSALQDAMYPYPNLPYDTARCDVVNRQLNTIVSDMYPRAWSADLMYAFNRLAEVPQCVKTMAKLIYQTDDWESMYTLADMIEEQDIEQKYKEVYIAHIRSNKHWRGCWIIDEILRTPWNLHPLPL